MGLAFLILLIKVYVYNSFKGIEKIQYFQEMIEEGDRDGDGEVNEDDFLRIMKKTGLY